MSKAKIGPISGDVQDSKSSDVGSTPAGPANPPREAGTRDKPEPRWTPPADKPADLPKVRGSVPPHWLFEIHFKQIDGHVFCVIHQPGKPQFPLYNGVVFNPTVAAREFVDAIEQTAQYGAPKA